MSEVRSRIEAHRHDMLVLLDAVTQTTRFREGSRLAGVVSYLAQAQALLAEELEGLPEVSKQEKAAKEEPAADSDETPPERIRVAKRKPETGHGE